SSGQGAQSPGRIRPTAGRRALLTGNPRVAYWQGGQRGRGLPRPGGSQSPAAVGSPPPEERPDAERAVRRARDDPPGRDEASRRSRRSQPAVDEAAGPREAAFHQPGADPCDRRPLDTEIRGAAPASPFAAQEGSRKEKMMARESSSTFVYVTFI